MGQLNQHKLVELPFDNFGGGYAGAKGISTLENNEAQTLDNIVVLPSGSGFRRRNGNTQYIITSDIDDNDGLEVLGLYTFYNGGNKWMLRLSRGEAGTSEVRIMIAQVSDPTNSTANSAYLTASYTFTQDSVFMFTNYENNAIGATADRKRPVSINLPNGTATLFVDGTPFGKVTIVWNNRIWMGNTDTNPSRLNYSILMSTGVAPYALTTWTNTGSGFVEPNRGDEDELTAIVPISNNVLLLFKQRSVHQVVGRTDPFAVFPLFANVGCVGRKAAVEVDGNVYFITPDKRMLITDGSRLFNSKDIPKLADADDLWESVSDSRLYLTWGFRHTGRDFDWIVWVTSSSASTTHDIAIIWDLQNQCWLYCSTGFNANVVASFADGDAYIGTYSEAGTYKLDGTNKYTDDSYGTPTFNGSGFRTGITGATAVSWKWRTDDLNLNSLRMLGQAQTVNALTKYSATGNLSLTYRYDGFADSSAITKSVVPTSLAYKIENYRPLGRGTTFGIEWSGSSNVMSQISRFSIIGRQQSSKDSGVR